MDSDKTERDSTLTSLEKLLRTTPITGVHGPASQYHSDYFLTETSATTLARRIMDEGWHLTLDRDEVTLKREAELRNALIEIDILLASLNWWHILNITKVGDILGNAIGWDLVRNINAQYAPKISPDSPSDPSMK